MSVTHVHSHAYIAPTATAAWTGDRVLARISEAMATLRLLGGAVGPTRSVTSWPDVVHSAEEAYGYTAVTGRRPHASPHDIARLEQVERWLTRHLTRDRCEAAGFVPDAGYVVTCRGMGWTYGRIAHARKAKWGAIQGHRRPPGGNSRPSIAAIERKALRHLATMLNNQGVPVDPETLGERR